MAISIKSVNKKIQALNIKAELVKGEGYFYFVGDDVEISESTSVMVPRITDLPLDGWISELNEIVKKAGA